MLDAQVGQVGQVDGARMPGSTAYLVTELVDGPTLSQLIKNATLTEQQVARVGAALGNALAYIHERGIVHRDIKPANILMAGTAEADIAPKLADFGIAVTVGSTRLTMDGLTLGTANYLSPEQVCGEAVTPASDVYSLGLVLMEAVTGALAFPGNGLEAALARLNRAPDVSQIENRGLRAVLKAMTARDPRLRPSAWHAAHTLEALAYAPQPFDAASMEEAPSLTSEILQLGQFATGATGRPVGVIEAAAGATRRLITAAAGALRASRRRVIVSAAAVLVVATCVAFVSAVAFGSTGAKQPTSVNPQPQQAIPPAGPGSRAEVPQGDAPPATAQRRQVPAPAPSARIIAVTTSIGKKSGEDGGGSGADSGDGKGRNRHGSSNGKGHH